VYVKHGTTYYEQFTSSRAGRVGGVFRVILTDTTMAMEN